MPSDMHSRMTSTTATARGRRMSRAGADGLPKYTADDRKPPTLRRSVQSSFWPYIPSLQRRLRPWLPNIGLGNFLKPRTARKRGSFFVFLAYLALIFIIFAFASKLGYRRKSWTGITRVPTLVFRREDLQRIWHWEIASGHHPSRRIPKELELTSPENPSIPPRSAADEGSGTIGVGSKRIYLDLASDRDRSPYPPRPIPGSVADLDILLAHCDFGTNQYVRDCLEVLRVGAALDTGKRVRRVIPGDWKYIYVEDPASIESSPTGRSKYPPTNRAPRYQSRNAVDDSKSRNAVWEPSPIRLPAVQPGTRERRSGPTAHCDPENPRLFHMFWTGDFTDKPFLALLSFLYTQNLGLHLSPTETSAISRLCPPKLMVWINPGFVYTQLNPHAREDTFNSLRTNQWSAPFLHPRFKDIIEFQFWNTTEQLDSVEELKHDWRHLKTIFNSGGYSIPVPKRSKDWPPPGQKVKRDVKNGEPTASADEGTMETSKISVVLSDLARFIVCHKFGGVYVDADTLFLRDWEELWNWRGAFAYRWSWHESYNTAVLRLNKGSALGTFLLRTALKNNFDFHPMTITEYLRDAKMEELLFRLPDALFDSAWLNMEGYQRDRPPMPHFNKFEEFFETQLVDSAQPQVAGFDGFYKGAFSYHFHNSWSRLTDPTRNFPDLPPELTLNSTHAAMEDKKDLNWSTVMKRTFEAYLRGEQGNMYGEWIHW